MGLKYDFFEVNELNKTKGKFRARAVSKGKINSAKLASWISQTHGISAAQAKAYIEMLTDSMLDFIADGYEVEVGKLGYFSASITSKLVDSPNEIRAETVRFNRLNFRANIRTKRTLRMAFIERVKNPRSKRVRKKYTLTEKGEILKKYLREKKLATRSDYSRLARISHKPSSVNDLNAFIEEGWLERHGAGRTVVYMLAN